MLKARLTKLGIMLSAVVVATVVSHGVARAEAEAGTIENNTSNEVQVTQTDNSQVDVTTQNQSTTTVGGSVDGTGTTPSITETQTNSFSTEPAAEAGEGTPPSQGDLSEPTATQDSSVSQPAYGEPSGPKNLSHSGVSQSAPDVNFPAMLERKDPVQPEPVKPAKEQGAPTPASPSNGSVTQVASGSGGGGKGIAGNLFGLRTAAPARLLIVLTALLLVAANCFVSYLRRTGYSHAPRSDDSVTDEFYDYEKPRVGMQALLIWASPAFFVAPYRQLTNLGRR